MAPMQRSRVAWLNEGGRNTKFFHQKARWRSRKNFIKKPKKYDGSWSTDQVEMRDMVVQYFTDLFQRDDQVNPQEIVELFDTVITDDINKELCKAYNHEEINDALFQIGPLKAPCPDGFPARFFLEEWAYPKRRYH